MAAVTIYVRLLDDGIDVWRPVAAKQLVGDNFQIEPNAAIPDGEQWQFQRGQQVRCRWRQFENGEGYEAFGPIS